MRNQIDAFATLKPGDWTIWLPPSPISVPPLHGISSSRKEDGIRTPCDGIAEWRDGYARSVGDLQRGIPLAVLLSNPLARIASGLTVHGHDSYQRPG